MKQQPSESYTTVICPICEKPAEEGCVYGADKNALRWMKGPPSWKNNVKTAFAGGEIIGESPLFKGSYAKGIKCEACARIVIELKGYPDPLD
jgi:hypothetical protein